MPNLTKGSFSLNLGSVQIGGELADEDRQCAWELCTELSTRVAVTGKSDDPDCVDFGGELYLESLDCVYVLPGSPWHYEAFPSRKALIKSAKSPRRDDQPSDD